MDEDKFEIVAHPDDDDQNKIVWWAVCYECGHGFAVEGTDLALGDAHNDPLIDEATRAHTCGDKEPDTFWAEEYGITPSAPGRTRTDTP